MSTTNMMTDEKSLGKAEMCMLIKDFHPAHALAVGEYIISDKYPMKEVRGRKVTAYKFSKNTERLYLHCPEMEHSYSWISGTYLQKVEEIVEKPEVFEAKEVENRAEQMLDAAMKLVMPFVRAVGARTILYALPAIFHYMIRKQTGKSEGASLSEAYSGLTQKAIDMTDNLVGLSVDEAMYVILMLVDHVTDTVLRHNAVGQLSHERKGAKS